MKFNKKFKIIKIFMPFLQERILWPPSNRITIEIEEAGIKGKVL